MKEISVLHQSLLDIVFRDRNQAYGAYELRLHYSQRLKKALCCMALAVVILALLLRLPSPGRKVAAPSAAPLTVNLSVIEAQPAEVPLVDQPHPPAAPKLVPTNAFGPPTVVKDVRLMTQEAPPDLPAIQSKVSGTGTTSGPVFGDQVTLSATQGTGNGQAAFKKNTPATFVSVEQMPRFAHSADDEESLRKIGAYLNARISYPEAARESGIEGTVVIRFLVGPQGNLSDIQLVGSDPGGGLGEEALRVVRSMPRWIPGRQNGRPVSVWFTLPVSFRLH